MKEILERAAQIKLVIFDVDGVLTDGSLYIDDNGRETKAFHSRDGHGMKMLQRTGVQIAIITGRTSPTVTYRMDNLGIQYVYQGQRDKLPAYQKLKNELGYKDEQIAYVGDDVVDLPVMRRVGFAVAVQDAHILVKQHAHWQTPNSGGRGAARDVCELIMEAQNNLDVQLKKYLMD